MTCEFMWIMHLACKSCGPVRHFLSSVHRPDWLNTRSTGAVVAGTASISMAKREIGLRSLFSQNSNGLIEVVGGFEVHSWKYLSSIFAGPSPRLSLSPAALASTPLPLLTRWIGCLTVPLGQRWLGANPSHCRSKQESIVYRIYWNQHWYKMAEHLIWDNESVLHFQFVWLP